MPGSRKTFIASSNLGSKDVEQLKPKIDLEYTTESQILKKMIVDYVTPRPFEGMNSFPAQIIDILKTEDEKKNFYLNKLSKTGLNAENSTVAGLASYDVFRYKVRILDMDFYKPIITLEKDKSVDSTNPNKNKIDEEVLRNNILIDYIYNTEFLARKDESYSIGDIVRVSFDNPNVQDFGYIEEKLAGAPEEKDPSADFSKPSAPFNQPVIPTGSLAGSGSTPPVIDMTGNPWKPLAAPDVDIIEKDAYARGQFIGKIKVKRVTPSQFLRIDAAEAFLAMKEAAKKDKINIMAGSCFRTMEQQINLYNGRYDPGYVPNVTAKQGKAQNKKKPPGEKNNPLTTAYPGTSNHQNGIAIDMANIPVNGWKTKEYEWLDKHAHEYGFSNEEGKDPAVNEAWHWTYVKGKNLPPEAKDKKGDKEEG